MNTNEQKPVESVDAMFASGPDDPPTMSTVGLSTPTHAVCAPAWPGYPHNPPPADWKPITAPAEAVEALPGELHWKLANLNPGSSGVVTLTRDEWQYVRTALAARPAADRTVNVSERCDACGEVVHLSIAVTQTQQLAVTDEAVERLAKYIYAQEARKCSTLDAFNQHMRNWPRALPEARAMLSAALTAALPHLARKEKA